MEMNDRTRELGKRFNGWNGLERKALKNYIDEHLTTFYSAHIALFSLLKRHEALCEDIKECKSAITKDLIQAKLEEIEKDFEKFYVIDTRMLDNCAK